MKKIFLTLAVLCGIGLMVGCKSGTTNDTANDSIITEDTMTIAEDSTIVETDTLPEEENDGVVSKDIDISLPLYTFKDMGIHDKLTQIIDGWEDDYDALEITYWPTVDTISTYGEDSLPYGYNLLVNTVHYYYHGDSYEDVAGHVAGCCMIGKKFCYIRSSTTRDRLFVKTSERKHHTVYSCNTVCPCLEVMAFIRLGEDGNLFHMPLEELHSVSIPNR